MIIQSVPFFSNTKDNTHCFQAVLKMALKYFEPEKEYSWEVLDRISAKEKFKWTWQMAGSIWLNDNNFEVVNIENFDYDHFSKQGKKYLVEEFGQEVADIQEKHSKLELEQKRALEFVEKVKVLKEIPTIDKLKQLITNTYLVICNVNSMALNHSEGYCGHFVLVKGFDDNNFIINNPGLPGQENQIVDFKTFEKAWAFPNEKAKNILAIRKAK